MSASRDEELELMRLRLAANVRAAREANGWTQEELSVRCGLHLTAVSKIERAGSLPEFATIIKLADAFERPLDELRAGISWSRQAGEFRIEPRRAADHRNPRPPAQRK